VASANGKNDGRLDLVLTRVVKVPRALIWKAWTEPKHLMKWFTPAPWQTVGCEIDLRPGGIFRTVMLSPEGADNASVGCYLEIIQNEKLVWTSALGPGFRPAANPFLSFTAVLTFEDHAGGTRYTARVLHKDESDRQKHADMGFEAGWGKALDQLVAIADQIQQ
jgi:uncharacterized protein YndB with AHSA1/START domain